MHIIKPDNNPYISSSTAVGITARNCCDVYYKALSNNLVLVEPVLMTSVLIQCHSYFTLVSSPTQTFVRLTSQFRLPSLFVNLLCAENFYLEGKPKVEDLHIIISHKVSFLFICTRTKFSTLRPQPPTPLGKCTGTIFTKKNDILILSRPQLTGEALGLLNLKKHGLSQVATIIQIS